MKSTSEPTLAQSNVVSLDADTPAAPERYGGPLGWWYRISAPPPVSIETPFAQRELARRGKLSSLILFVMIIFTFMSFPAAFANPNPLLFWILIINLIGEVVAIPLIRRSHLTIAGLCIVVPLVGTVFTNIATTPHGLSASTLLLFGFMPISEVLAASLLPPIWVFAVALVNSVYTAIALAIFPRDQGMQLFLQSSYYYATLIIIIVLVVIALVVYLWVSSAMTALRRADRAEEIARLQFTLAEQDRQIAEQKERLEHDIKLLEAVHQQVANGDPSARVPMAQITVLWSIAGKLNILLARLQEASAAGNQQAHATSRLKQVEGQLQWLMREIERITQAIRAAKASRTPVHLTPGNTPVDMLIYELTGGVNTSEPVSSSGWSGAPAPKNGFMP